MRTNNIMRTLCGVLTAALLASCSGKNEWTVNGKIEGAEGQTMILESSENGRWFVIDSIKINDVGQFTAHHKAAGYPDIYRLRLGDKTLYFPIDSIETVTVVTRADAFDNEYTISGSSSAERLMAADRMVMEAVRKGGSGVSGDSVLKRELSQLLLQNPAGIVSYYIINKQIGGVPLFNPSNKSDLRVIGAVANAYTQFRPNDPRTAYLTRLFLSNRKSATATDTIQANEVNLINIDLLDRNGKHQELAKVARQNPVVVLNFTAYEAEFSPALNVALNRVWERHHGNGLQIYQVSVDGNEVLWRQASKNLPWITVYNPANDSRALTLYNVGGIPTTFIISNGVLVERLEDVNKLESAVAKYL